MQDGVSLCQVADGALNGVNDILLRLEELAVKAANGTNSAEDRSYMQQEVQSLREEIDRISATTTFNEIPLFRGVDEVVQNGDGTPAVEGDIPFSDFKLADLSLGQNPITHPLRGTPLRCRQLWIPPDLHLTERLTILSLEMELHPILLFVSKWMG